MIKEQATDTLTLGNVSVTETDYCGGKVAVMASDGIYHWCDLCGKAEVACTHDRRYHRPYPVPCCSFLSPAGAGVLGCRIPSILPVAPPFPAASFSTRRGIRLLPTGKQKKAPIRRPGPKAVIGLCDNRQHLEVLRIRIQPSPDKKGYHRKRRTHRIHGGHKNPPKVENPRG